MQQKQVLALYCAILAPFVGLGIYLYLHNTQSITLVPKVANYTVDTAAFSSLKAIPDLKRDVLVRSTYTDTDSAKLVAKINTVRVRLQKNPQNADDWFTLGLLYHDAGDYEKVREVWEFLLSVIVGPQ